MRAWIFLTVSLAGAGPLAAQMPDSAQLRHARELHRLVPMIDGHNDFAWEVRAQYHGSFEGHDMAAGLPLFTGTDSLGHDIGFMTDIPRMRAGGMGGQFWSIYVPDTMIHAGATRVTLEQIDIIKRMEQRWPRVFLPARTAADIERAHREGKIASLMGIEGGHSIENSIGALRMFFDLGIRYMTLTWNNDLAWADANAGTRSHNGLTPFGLEVVREMNRLGMLVDISHVSDSVMAQVLRNSEAPVIFSHSSARALSEHRRNVPDYILRMVPHNGGVVMVNFYCDFVDSVRVRWNRERAAAASQARSQAGGDTAAVRRVINQWESAHPEPPAPPLSIMADHIEHIRDVAGVDHVGYGSDFDGIECAPQGLNDVSTFPRLTAELVRRGWSDADIEKVLGLNLLRVLRGAEATARRLQASRPPSTATIGQLDSAAVR
ncbi:MAG TPA: dipeptidase [Gemmatimonadales bacterium]|jgi:membrane dipeptidase